MYNLSISLNLIKLNFFTKKTMLFIFKKSYKPRLIIS